MNGLKRQRSPSYTDDDDEYSEDGGQMCSIVTGSTDPHLGGTTGGGTRKRRRGVIEKRRRDRINHSLNELKRLVPTALEKSGSAKLEKAEILQMTVDHLKMLHSKGIGHGYDYDPHRFAMDYHSIGFRECATEVSRYLMAAEGMDLQDPLRVRLMSHLQMVTTSRQSYSAPPVQQNSQMMPSATSWSTAATATTGYASSPIVPPTGCGSGNYTPPSSSLDISSSSSGASTTSPEMTSLDQSSSYFRPIQNQYQCPYGEGGNLSTVSGPVSSAAPAAVTSSYTLSHTQSQSKQQPYRPWGAEMAC